MLFSLVKTWMDIICIVVKKGNKIMTVEKFMIKNVGPSTAETVELQFQGYIDAFNYRNGKTFKELMNEKLEKRRR